MAFLGGVLSAGTKLLDDNASIGCVEHLRLPEYTVYSRSARLEGKAEVFVNLGSDGKIKQIDVTGVHPTLAREIRADVTDSTFTARCSGSTFRLHFEFRLEGAEWYGSFQSTITFFPPNRFVIVTTPPKAMVD
jgi:hypothetical protein